VRVFVRGKVLPMTGESSEHFAVSGYRYTTSKHRNRRILCNPANCDLLYEFLSMSCGDIADRSNANDDETLAALLQKLYIHPFTFVSVSDSTST